MGNTPKVRHIKAPTRPISEQVDEQLSSEAGDAMEQLRFLPPWRELIPGIGLSPPYGPCTRGAYERQIQDYEQSRAGGGLWDDEEQAASSQRLTPKQAAEKARYDQTEVDAFFARLATLKERPPPRELEAAYLYWRDKLSWGVIARRMGGVAVTTVKEWIRRTRKRVRGEPV